MASRVRHIARDKCNFLGNLQTKSNQTNCINMKQVHLLLAKVMDICYINTLGLSSDISHSKIKVVVDTNLLEVAGSSETKDM